MRVEIHLSRAMVWGKVVHEPETLPHIGNLPTFQAQCSPHAHASATPLSIPTARMTRTSTCLPRETPNTSKSNGPIPRLSDLTR
ncbi:hypothetical protein BOTBODRAFT_25652 [Botryobasidium botryosum FD-172 SS1]|uniref:Uncharacterized protein n=1 Tax=Botryobasidium botryosum (strain FD-172 SS1) TaxID=930990 RepID=A0A067NBR6_BOTB1|nr:hypothetical protein BOTBODRAFT_25652 [Botryobasidium botryosum FD-172 SS1]